MTENAQAAGKGKKTSSLQKRKVMEYAGFAVLVLLYIAAALNTPQVSRSSELIVIGDIRVPVQAFTGVLSTLANICLICLVVFYRKPGFIVGLSALLIQLPFWIFHMVFLHNTASIPGGFGFLLTLFAMILVRSRDKKIDQYRRDEMEQLTERQKLTERLFEKTAEALATAIDAKDEYSRGHSMRVADYAEKIARRLGKDDEECKNVYYAGLLHDVGKIGITDAIINKKSSLTPGEYDTIKKHPVLGMQILSSISDYPYISDGAHYHHERYDGTGYPDGLKGEEIPEIARIISVADAYDTLTSNRVYRSAFPQQTVREEIIRGAGTQFDPKIAMIMRDMIDEDRDFRMKEPGVTPGGISGADTPE